MLDICSCCRIKRALLAGVLPLSLLVRTIDDSNTDPHIVMQGSKHCGNVHLLQLGYVKLKGVRLPTNPRNVRFPNYARCVLDKACITSALQVPM